VFIETIDHISANVEGNVKVLLELTENGDAVILFSYIVVTDVRVGVYHILSPNPDEVRFLATAYGLPPVENKFVFSLANGVFLAI
jgi:hypothetical protein